MPTCSKCQRAFAFHELTNFYAPEGVPCERLCIECVAKELERVTADRDNEMKWAKQYHDDWVKVRDELERVKLERDEALVARDFANHYSDTMKSERDQARAELHLAKEDTALWKKSESEACKAYDECKAELERVQKREAAYRDDLIKCREFVARFLVPWSHHLSESWLSGFEESGCVVFDSIGFVKPKPTEPITES